MTVFMQKVTLDQKLTRWIPVSNMLQKLWNSGTRSLWHSDCCYFEWHPLEGTADPILTLCSKSWMHVRCQTTWIFGLAIFGTCTRIINFLSWEVLLLYILQNKMHLFEKLGKYWCSCLTVNMMLTEFNCCYCS